MIVTFDKFLYESIDNKEENKSFLKKVAEQFHIDMGFITTFSVAMMGYVPICYEIFDKLTLNVEVTPYLIICIVVTIFGYMYKESLPEIKKLISFLKEQGVAQSSKNIFDYLYEKLKNALDFAYTLFPYTMLFVVFERTFQSLYTSGTISIDQWIQIGFGIGITGLSYASRFVIHELYKKMKKAVLIFNKKSEEKHYSYVSVGDIVLCRNKSNPYYGIEADQFMSDKSYFIVEDVLKRPDGKIVIDLGLKVRNEPYWFIANDFEIVDSLEIDY